VSQIDEDLVTLLLNQSQIIAVVGSRIYLDEAPQTATLPYVVITEMDVDGNVSLDGGTDNLQFVNYDVDCYGATRTKARDLAKLIRDFIKDFSGETGGTQTIKAVVMNGEASDRIPPTDGKGPSTFVRTLDITIQFNPV